MQIWFENIQQYFLSNSTYFALTSLIAQNILDAEVFWESQSTNRSSSRIEDLSQEKWSWFLMCLGDSLRNIQSSFCVDKWVQFYIRWTNLTTMPLNELVRSFKSKIDHRYSLLEILRRKFASIMKSLNKFLNGLCPILLNQVALKEQRLKMQNLSSVFTVGLCFNAKVLFAYQLHVSLRIKNQW